MGKRRKVSNLLGLHILATLTVQPLHPYEIAAQLRAFGKDQDIKIQWGSLYTVVRNLEKHGFIEAAETVREGRRPERTVYRLTEAGRHEMADWLRELIGQPEQEFPRLRSALSVAGVLPPDEMIELLRQRHRTLTAENEADRAALTATRREVPRLFLIEAEYALAMRQAEEAWLAGLLRELHDGSVPGLGAWRRFHETGVMPDLSELMGPGAPPE
ncbi:PadR family transcriptional regulator [Actinoplanes philippinensis]|uniref:DNA-binding transcriptional regulator, PadR family n=1 Tax=Actinoplanes philippinensis TaxID=35752 RepID=A0A1I1ZNF8_9ACTN|nr:PadR family transcriptional regulator [Actinoplanes philippinensis]GIE75401.1 PadR family transcriptional regulator [Actinoplanes philippinensis]SFE32888.1 DNA-binding transcriptional regulator, PadR family [Actinoplanes philippinensis]